jgi:hypothetical protein
MTFWNNNHARKEKQNCPCQYRGQQDLHGSPSIAGTLRKGQIDN